MYLRIIICCNTLLVHLISSVSAAFIFSLIYSEKRRLPHARVHSMRMLTSMRLHLIRMLTSMRFHSIRMLPQLSLCSICILSYTCLCAACSSLCICFPNLFCFHCVINVICARVMHIVSHQSIIPSTLAALNGI